MRDPANSLKEYTPFENIALAFSGGGFRAAAFALGVLSYLQYLKLENENGDETFSFLKNVKFIASTSGGSITNSLYAYYMASGKEFEEFYKKLFETLNGNDLLDEALSILNDDKAWKTFPGKKRNMINSFALAYDKKLFEGALLGDLVNKDTHLEEICLNATDFFRGVTFRQSVKMKPDENEEEDVSYRYGNKFISLKPEAARKLRLSDLLAASSCFPAGFEPIIFPTEFVYDINGSKLDKKEISESLNIPLNEYSQLKASSLERLYGKKFVEEKKKELKSRIPKPLSQIFEKGKNSIIEIIRTLFPSDSFSEDFQFALMDGGITDNQGLESTLDAHDRRKKKNRDTSHKGQTGSYAPFDLMLVNDVGSHFMDPYDPDKKTSRKFNILNFFLHILTVNRLFWGSVVFLAAGLLSVGISMFKHSNLKIWETLALTVAGTFVAVISSILIFLIWYIRWKIKKEMKKNLGLRLDRNFPENIIRKLFKHFQNIKLNVLVRMLDERLRSVLVLNNDIFLKRIRFLLYDKAYETRKNKFRIKGNRLYDLTLSNDLFRHDYDDKFPDKPVADQISNESGEDGMPKASENLRRVSQYAFEMRTTLWFETKEDEPDRRAALIATGQFTTCYNLIRYIYLMKKRTQDRETGKDNESIYEQIPEQYQQRIDHLYEKLKNDLKIFSDNPFYQYNQIGSAWIDDFEKAEICSYPIPEDFKDLR